MTASVCHLIDANADTAYFRALATHHDSGRFSLSVGSIAATGPLQLALSRLGCATYALAAAGRLRLPIAAVRLARHLRSSRHDILHAHCFYPTLVGLAGARLAGCRFVFTRHHSDHNVRLGKRWHVAIDGGCARRADRVIAVSQATRRVMTDVEGVPPSRIRVVLNGMDPPPSPDAASVAALAGELGLSSGSRVCLVVGRLHEEKGHAVLLQAMPAILQSHPHTRLVVAGDGPHATVIRQLAERSGLRPAPSFLGQRGDVPRLMALADVVVVPSLAESFGFVALEAMALGRPVVAAATGGLVEIVEHEKSGLLVPKGDARALAAAVTRVLSAPDLARRLGEQGRARSAEFTAERMVRGYEAVYGELLEH